MAPAFDPDRNERPLSYEERVIHFRDQLKRVIAGLLYALTGCSGSRDVEDLVQKTSIRLLRVQDQFNTKKGTFESWASQQAKWQVLQHRRKEKRQRLAFDNDLAERIADRYLGIHLSFEESLDGHLFYCWNNLSEQDRLLMYGTIIEEYSAKELEAQTALSHTAIRQRLSRARTQLRTCLENHQSQPADGGE